MADLKTLINRMEQDGRFDIITRNPLAQFGEGSRVYVGASILPESGVSKDFTLPVVYTVESANGASQAWTVTLTVL